MAPILPLASPSALAIAPIPAPATSLAAGSGTPGGAAFQSVLTDAVQKVEGFGNNAAASVNNFLSGDGEELHDVAIQSQEAEMSFDLFLQVRNKIVSAYQEVMRMQV
jgi:flagellar hook-basal body complex protein FliE